MPRLLVFGLFSLIAIAKPATVVEIAPVWGGFGIYLPQTIVL